MAVAVAAAEAAPDSDTAAPDSGTLAAEVVSSEVAAEVAAEAVAGEAAAVAAGAGAGAAAACRGEAVTRGARPGDFEFHCAAWLMRGATLLTWQSKLSKQVTRIQKGGRAGLVIGGLQTTEFFALRS